MSTTNAGHFFPRKVRLLEFLYQKILRSAYFQGRLTNARLEILQCCAVMRCPTGGDANRQSTSHEQKTGPVSTGVWQAQTWLRILSNMGLAVMPGGCLWIWPIKIWFMDLGNIEDGPESRKHELWSLNLLENMRERWSLNLENKVPESRKHEIWSLNVENTKDGP